MYYSETKSECIVTMHKQELMSKNRIKLKTWLCYMLGQAEAGRTFVNR